MSLKNYIFTSINTKGLDGEDFAKNFTIRVKNKRDTRKLSAISEEERKRRSSQPQPPPGTDFERLRRSISTTDDIGWFKKIMKLWSYISVEPVMICWILPTCLLYIAIENLALEKVIMNTLTDKTNHIVV